MESDDMPRMRYIFCPYQSEMAGALGDLRFLGQVSPHVEKDATG